ncbi:MAG: hypothetical protein NC901_03190 [Candidatus Omnitrophica bacterium]|nr:hypothetical protein [Candidatus Omnitrophota bacterium]
MYLNEFDVIQHIPEELRNRMKQTSTYYSILNEKINIAERYIIFNVLKYKEMPDEIPEDIKLVMEIQAAILMIENYTLIEPQFFNMNIEENEVRGSLARRLNSMLKEIQTKYQDYTLVETLTQEESFLDRYIKKSGIFDNE